MSLSKSLAGALSLGSSSFAWHSIQELFFCAETVANSNKIVSPGRAHANARYPMSAEATLLISARSVAGAARPFWPFGRPNFIAASRHISDDCQYDDVKERQHAQDIEDPSPPAIVRPLHERHYKQKQRHNIKSHNADHFAVEAHYLCGYQL